VSWKFAELAGNLSKIDVNLSQNLITTIAYWTEKETHLFFLKTKKGKKNIVLFYSSRTDKTANESQ